MAPANKVTKEDIRRHAVIGLANEELGKTLGITIAQAERFARITVDAWFLDHTVSSRDYGQVEVIARAMCAVTEDDPDAQTDDGSRLWVCYIEDAEKTLDALAKFMETRT